MPWHPKTPYNNLPLLPPRSVLETHGILKRCISARASLATLKQAAHLIPNQAMLIGTLPLLEARASSEIENIVTTADKLFRDFGSELQADPATKEALRYSRALYDGYRSLKERPIGTRTAERICSTIKGVEMTVRNVPGTALVNSANGKIVYTPPVGEPLLRDLMANWEAYVHADDGIDPLIKMAVAHYQFEAIHPFTDGNGRTGRVLNSLFLIEKDLLTLPILYLSRFIIARRAEYYRLLQDVTSEGKWEPWLLYMLDGVEQTSDWTGKKIAAISNLADATVDYMRRRIPKIYSYELASMIFRLPYCRIANIVEDGIARRQTASIYLRKLVEIGILTEAETTKDKLFINSRLLHLLTTDSNNFEPFSAT